MQPVKAAAMTLFIASGIQAAERITYEEHIKPLMETRCIGCHGVASPLIEEFDKDIPKFKAMNLGPRMDSYELLKGFIDGGDAGAIARRLDDGSHSADGKPGNMYENLGDSAEERAKNLVLFKEWAGLWSLKKPAQLTDAESALFKALER